MLHRILKGIASLLLAILAFCAIALLYFTFLLTSAIEDRIYAHALDDIRAYSRIYSELLTPDLVTDIRKEYAPELALLTSEDTVDFIRTTAPPRYVRKQTESNLRRLSMYLKGDSQQLRLYLDLSDPLEKVPIALADLIGARAAETPELLIEQARPITAQVTNHEPATDIAADLETLLTGGVALGRAGAGAQDDRHRLRLEGRRPVDQTRFLERVCRGDEPEVDGAVRRPPAQALQPGAHGIRVDLRADADLELRRIERLELAYAAAASDQVVPERLDIRADGGGDAESGDRDSAWVRHGGAVSVRSSPDAGETPAFPGT